MELKEKKMSKKSGKAVISIFMIVVASIVAILGVVTLINNVYIYKSAVTQYVAQGYAVATVRKELLTSQLLPGIFEPIALYGGIAFLLLGVSIVNKKVSKCLMLLTKVEVKDDAIKESIKENKVAEEVVVEEQPLVEEAIVEENVAPVENIESTQQIKTEEEVIKS